MTSNFFFENSYQQTYLSGIVTGWFTLDMDRPINAATCDYSLISGLAEQAASSAGVIRPTTAAKFMRFPKAGAAGGD